MPVTQYVLCASNPVRALGCETLLASASASLNAKPQRPGDHLGKQCATRFIDSNHRLLNHTLGKAKFINSLAEQYQSQSLWQFMAFEYIVKIMRHLGNMV